MSRVRDPSPAPRTLFVLAATRSCFSALGYESAEPESYSEEKSGARDASAEREPDDCDHRQLGLSLDRC